MCIIFQQLTVKRVQVGDYGDFMQPSRGRDRCARARGTVSGRSFANQGAREVCPFPGGGERSYVRNVTIFRIFMRDEKNCLLPAKVMDALLLSKGTYEQPPFSRLARACGDN